MNDKRQTRRNRQLAMAKIKAQLALFYREDLEEIQQAIADALPNAQPAPADDQLVAPGEWLEERRVAGKDGNPDRYYVYSRWIDGAGKQRGTIVFHGTLAQYKASSGSSA